MQIRKLSPVMLMALAATAVATSGATAQVAAPPGAQIGAAPPAVAPAFRDGRRLATPPRPRGKLQPGPVPELPGTAPTGDATAVAAAIDSGRVAASAPSSPAAAAEVALRMKGGGFEVKGELRGFDGTRYLIDTRESGAMTFEASRFECIGAACARPAMPIIALAERLNPAKPDQFAIVGSPVIGTAIMPALVRGYAQSLGATASELEAGDPGKLKMRIADARGAELASIEILMQGSGAGAAALERGAATIAMTDRPLTAEELARLSAGAPKGRAVVQEHTVGVDGVAVIAAPHSPLVSIRTDLLAKILAGEITDWFELGHAPARINVYAAGEASGTTELVSQQLLRPRGIALGAAVIRVASEAEVGEKVEHDPHGIGITSFAAVGKARPLNIETECGLIVRPTTFGLKSEEYPLIRRLSLVSIGQPGLAAARGIVRFAASQEGRALIAETKLADHVVDAVALESQAERMAHAINAPAAAFDMQQMRQMLGELQGARRLSATFRFAPGTNDLDARSRKELARLAQLLQEPDYKGRRMTLVGYTDAGGRFDANLAVSQKRAAQVRTALLALTGTFVDQGTISAKGYGPLAPVACSSSPDGLRLNRRVEVWMAGS